MVLLQEAACYALLAVATLVSVVALVWLHLRSRSHPTPPLPHRHTHETHVRRLGPRFLAVYRSFAALYNLGILIAFFIDRGFIQIRFFTVWNYILLILCFSVGALLSWQELFRRCMRGSEEPDRYRPMSALGHVFIVMYELSLASVFLVDTVFWFLLLPLAVYVGHWGEDTLRLKFFNVWSYHEHIGNLFFLMGELVLNRLPVWRSHVFFVSLWACVYSIYIIAVHRVYIQPDWWPYPIMDTSRPYAPAMYVGTLSVAVGYYFLCYGLYRLKHSLERRCGIDLDDAGVDDEGRVPRRADPDAVDPAATDLLSNSPDRPEDEEEDDDDDDRPVPL